MSEPSDPKPPTLDYPPSPPHPPDDPAPRTYEPYRGLSFWSRMTIFDKICSLLAAFLGAVFILLGGFGLFMGCNFNFTLSPIFGVLPALVGWGILKSVIVAFRFGR